MAAANQLEQDEVAMKVLRRAHVSKMTRALQDRLALANVKMQNGWENMSLDAIEPRVEERMRRKRPASSNDTISDTASTTSSRVHSSLASSPLTAPMFSEDMPRSGASYGNGNKRIKPLDLHTMHSSGAVTRRRDRAQTGRNVSWKKSRGLPESSPISHTKHARFPSTNMTSLSFISEGSTIADEPPSPEFSEEDDADLPVHSFSLHSSTRITSSPPQTPPPDRRMRKAHNVAWSRTPKTGDAENADLLLYLATSPSHPVKGESKTAVQPPSTPPCKSTPLPSSHMTPGMNGSNWMGFGPNTPGTNFNFADFVNVTPSPAQGAFTRTPVAGRTPATSSTRRKLNFDNLMPPTSSPELRRGRSDGLGMELGGELVSSQ